MNTNDGSSAANDYDNAMQRAFQEFMLTGGKKAASPSPEPLPLPAAQQERKNKKKQQRQRQRRSIYIRHQSALQDFNNVLVRDWLHIDDQLGRVVDSIANLRHRIQITNARLVKQQESTSYSSVSIKSSKTISSWKTYGYRGGSLSSSFSMTCQNLQQQQLQKQQQQVDDLELALSHSLLMHENMMATLRKPLLPLLHEAQETLGRRLQDFMSIVEDSCTADMLTVAADVDDVDDNQENDDCFEWMSRMQTDLQQCQELYRALAEELYRKQDLIQVFILDTVHDGLLGLQNNNNSNNIESFSSHVNVDDMTTNHPQASADWCSAQWSRQGKASALYKFQDLLDRVQQPQQQQQDDKNDAKKASAASRT